MKSASININSSQLEAVTTTEGPVLIIAGPGSGKTFTLVERITYLITEKNISPENILISTFTEKAAKEIITRISNRLSDLDVEVNINDMYIGTLHSICLRILKDNLEYTRLKKNYRTLDQFEQQYFIYQNIKEFLQIEGYENLYKNNKILSNWRQSNFIVTNVNKLSEENIDPEKLINFNDYKIKVLGKVYKKYLELIKEENIIDFSTIQTETYRLLEENPKILEKLHDQIKYLMIDEYQDTNSIQEKIIFKLCGKQNNICVVGDDDQGLYRFRGATIRNILEFPDKFNGNCKIVTLNVNYRSHPDIINFYNKWINENEWDGFRYEKNIIPREDDFIENPSVVKVSGEDFEDNWQEEILDFINSLKKSGKLKDLNQIAFLFRSVKNDKVVRLAHFLEENNIPVYSPRANMFFKRDEIKYIIGALLVVFPQWETIARDEDLWDYYQSCVDIYIDYIKKDKEMFKWTKKMAKTHADLEVNTDYAFSGIFYRMIKFKLFKQYLDDNNNLNKIKDCRESRNIATMSNLIAQFEYLHNISVLTAKNIENSLFKFFNVYLRFLIEGGIDEYEDMTEYAPSGCVSFMTIHQSKGMEFPVVFVGSLEASPRNQQNDIDEILENYIYEKELFEPNDKIKYFDFWRLYYTAFSRAQNLLCLTCIESIHKSKGQRNVPSKYFRNIYKDVIDWKNLQFKISNLELEEVKSTNLKQEYSFTSHILLYENCPLQYKFYKELEFSPIRKGSTIFGILVHQTIEDIHRAIIRGEKNSINEDVIAGWFNANYNSLLKKEKTYLDKNAQKSAFNQVMSYFNNNDEILKKVKEAEVEVALVKPEYILKGTIDLIQGHGDKVDIVDFKSERKPDIYEERDKIERYRRQLEIYAHLVEEKTDYKVDRLNLYYTGEKEGSPFISFKKKSSSIDHTIGEIDKVIKRIENKDFNIKEKPKKLCNECDMRFYCEN
ncbi:ATP-dependent DNA helicase [Terrisporobacter sp.]|uniref:ATP-dependent DNA helicase n=1 Tax=Terrisporobacter sp. TaxID=1965305 RepID=UPI0039931AE6